VLVYNVLLLAGFVGSGAAAYLLAHHLTRSTKAALVATAVFTMAPYRIEHIMHLELQWAMFIPLTFWALHRVAETGSWKHGLLAGVFLFLQVLSCVYYGVFLAMVLVVFVPALLLCAGRARAVRSMPPLAAAAGIALVLTLPYALPYRTAAREVGSRDLAEIARYSATGASYLASAGTNWLWGWTADRWGGPELRLYPGVVAVLLAIAAAVRRPPAAVALYAVTLVTALDLSFGTHGFLYPLVARHASPSARWRCSPPSARRHCSNDRLSRPGPCSGHRRFSSCSPSITPTGRWRSWRAIPRTHPTRTGCSRMPRPGWCSNCRSRSQTPCRVVNRSTRPGPCGTGSRSSTATAAITRACTSKP
jgi:hypothetical protein